MAKRRKEEAQETRERLLDAAIEVFHARGVARPSLTEVAELAGVTRGAIYGHFENKADLFGALTERVRLPGEALCEASAESRDPLKTMRMRWQYLFTETARNRQWQQILDIIFHRCELVTESGEIRERLLQGRAEGLRRISDLIGAAVEAGQLPAALDIKAAAHFMHASLIGVLQDWLLQPDAFDLATDGMRCFDALIEMLRTSALLAR